MKRSQKVGSRLCKLAGVLVALSLAPMAKATPYASCITNTSGTISFYLNESNANVTITYGDGTTNANFNGVTTGTGLASGLYSFSLGAEITYSISVTKTNPTLGVIKSVGRSNARGIDVNKNPLSPFFGNIYSVNSATTNIFQLNSDLSTIRVSGGGVAWVASTLSPYRIYVASDDFLMAGDASTAHAGVWRLAPDLSSNQLFLGAPSNGVATFGENNGTSSGVYGTIQSRPLLIGTVAGGNARLMDVDGDISLGNGYNSLLIYDIGSGPVPWTNLPSAYGPDVGVGLSSEALGDNEYPGLTAGPNGYIYASTYRNNLSNPLIQIYDSTGTNPVWNSWMPTGTAYPGGTPTGDFFLQTVSGITQGIIDSAVSPDGNYLVGVSIDNWFVVVGLTNGIPNLNTLFVVTPTSFSGNARGIAFDAADNVYLSSSGLGLVQEWSLGLSATAITTGDASGTTGFQLILPSTQVSVIPSVNAFASQGGSNGTPGTPTSSSFTITRSSTNGYALPLLVDFTLTGTAPSAAYTVSSPDGTLAAGNAGVIIPANETNVTVVITPVTNNVPRLTTAVILTLVAGGSYQVSAPFTDTNYIENTSSQELQIVSGGATSMYKAFSNDYASFIVQRLGDTNAPAYTATNFTLTGTAVAGVDYTLPLALTFSPGDVNHTNFFNPLSNGVPPVDVINPAYAGDKTIIAALASGGAVYSNTTATATMTILDNADPPGTVLYSDSLTTTNDASNWYITYGTGDETNYPANFEVDFGYDLTGNTPTSSGFSSPIPFPPSGASNALRITCNKNFNPGAAGGVNVYYTNKAFAGNYAVRFNMNLIEGANPNYTTEGVMFGINHTGTESNWWYGSGPFYGGPWGSDGVWYWVTADPGGAAAGDYIAFTGAGGTNNNTGWQMVTTSTYGPFVNVFKDPTVYTTTEGSGVPANGSTFNSLNDSIWSDVEIKQINNVVTMTINKTSILVYTNTTVWKSGYLMLGYEDPFGGTGGVSVETLDAAAYFSNLQVVQLGPPVITSVAVKNNQVVIQFVTTDADDTVSSFSLLSSGTSGAPHVDGAVAAATFTQPGPGLTFQVTTAKPTNAAQYYRIKHN
jgi:hypothetical protein